MTLQMLENNLLELLAVAIMVTAVSLTGFYINRISIHRRQRRALQAIKAEEKVSDETAEYIQ